jgi:hypothetical protein
MRREFAAVAASVLSPVLGLLIASLGDGRAQYGMLLLLVALPFYATAVVCCIALHHWLVWKFHLQPSLAYARAAVFSMLLGALVFAAGGGWVSTLALAVSLISAFALFSAFQSEHRHTSNGT